MNSPKNTRRFKHKASGQIHVLLYELFENGQREMVTVQDNVFSGGTTESWLGPSSEFAKQFTPFFN